MVHSGQHNQVPKSEGGVVAAKASEKWYHGENMRQSEGSKGAISGVDEELRMALT